MRVVFSSHNAVIKVTEGSSCHWDRCSTVFSSDLMSLFVQQGSIIRSGLQHIKCLFIPQVALYSLIHILRLCHF